MLAARTRPSSPLIRLSTKAKLSFAIVMNLDNITNLDFVLVRFGQLPCGTLAKMSDTCVASVSKSVARVHFYLVLDVGQ
jgi:hypothetical protein